MSVVALRRRRRCSLALLSLLAAVFTARETRADDARYQDFPVGSRATALGGSFVALGDDPSGLYYNPAGICDSRRLNVSVSASLYGFERQSQGAIQINSGTFSLATLNTLNVIPGEAGLIKGVGALDERGTPFAFGFDVTVPSFRAYGIDTATPLQLHTRVIDRTFDLAAGVGWRHDERLNFGFALHYVLRLFDQSEDALISDGAADPKVGVYHASASFQNANLVGLAGMKWRVDDVWTVGAALGLPGIPIHSAGTVRVQDVISDPGAPAGSRTQVTIINTSEVESRTPVPLLIRLGAARIEPHHWTFTGQATLHLGASYDRFGVAPEVSQRLRIESRVERGPVLDLNLGGEYLLGGSYSIALGLFTDRSGAPDLQVNPDNSLRPGSSRLANVSLYGGTATLGLIGQHSISRLGMSMSYGSGEDATAKDPSGVFDATSYTRASVHQLFLYFFLASTFRY